MKQPTTFLSTGPRPCWQCSTESRCYHGGGHKWQPPSWRPKPRWLTQPMATARSLACKSNQQQGQSAQDDIPHIVGGARGNVQPPGVPANLNKMQGAVPPEIIKMIVWRCLLDRLGFILDATQANNHGYETMKKLSHLKPNYIDILVKNLHLLDRECNNGTRDSGIVLSDNTHLLQCGSCCIIMYDIPCTQWSMWPLMTCLQSSPSNGKGRGT